MLGGVRWGNLVERRHELWKCNFFFLFANDNEVGFHEASGYYWTRCAYPFLGQYLLYSTSVQ